MCLTPVLVKPEYRPKLAGGISAASVFIKVR